MGKPWSGVWCEFIGGPREFRLMPTEALSINSPWVLTDGTQPSHPLCTAATIDYLPKGDYYTRIELNFHFSKGNRKKIIRNRTYTINFKIN